VKTITGAKSLMSVASNIFLQILAKTQKSFYSIKLDYLKDTMIIGVDSVKAKSDSIIGFTASYDKEMTQYYTRAIRQFRTQEEQKAPTKDLQEMIFTEQRTQILKKAISSAIRNYKNKALKRLPKENPVDQSGYDSMDEHYEDFGDDEEEKKSVSGDI
jgi:hypothetical protein